jgi:hypothetical protein
MALTVGIVSMSTMMVLSPSKVVSGTAVRITVLAVSSGRKVKLRPGSGLRV